MTESKDAEFTDFVAHHGGHLLRTACLVTGDSHRGEDLLQTALAKAYGSWSKVRAADHPVAYVRRLMINAHLSWLRRLANAEQVVESLPETGSGDLQAAHAETDVMRRALLTLSPRVRTAVVLRYFDDLSEADTARVMGCSRSTVNNHITKGLAALRVLLAATGDDLTPTSRRTS
ncbi:SigE family RNA polymerase sigma factor [Blastococcus xanthinilyticus]|uniref:RNA polymerase sigma-70 factor (Sigma-E family) n=1 Tax=Blastococcus xanthinilyticus TaxID=1564164 RepID=A0A5S5CVK5_9ACTN|nr:SigE family RNA polymerase sigma factor [Blastococcus xanthinilyticus]TYP87124.1 RNA polymerase sigma-70 factor (sigma-E family) [Blastococcus xanthinilyticus]